MSRTQNHGGATPRNRLAEASSPYLLLHQGNPVDWYPWGAEALERSRREGKPIFLSVGYATCHWCHVMERESFSDPEIARRMNEAFVNVKVDREERPDLDEIYMTATQLMTGHGGWPNSVFLTPDLRPFYAGTYFPPRDRHGLPGFPTVIDGVDGAWRRRREEVSRQAAQVAEVMGQYLEQQLEPAAQPPPPRVVAEALSALERQVDRQWGGFGGAPKFPTPASLFLLLDLLEEPPAREMLDLTLDRMLRGGIYDQLAGGFHRYATDREWRIPHFEKMLYDNGSLIEVYARAYAAGGAAEHRRIVEETAAFLERELTAPEGSFWSAIDAESGGEEGAFHVWSREELEQALGEEDAAFLAPLYGFDGPPFFEGDRYVLHWPRPLEEQADKRRLERAELIERMAPLREKLLETRQRREPPLTDDKVLADWNGLAIAGLAVAGKTLEAPELVERAARAARHVLSALREDQGGMLHHVWRQGRAGVPAFLSDYAYLVHGLLALHDADRQGRWAEPAVSLTEEQIDRLRCPEGGFFTAAGAPDVLFRSRDPFDGASPSPNGVAVLNLLGLAEATGESRWLEEAESALRAFAPLIEAQPMAARTLVVATHRWHRRSPAAGMREVPGAVPRPPSGLEDEALRVVEPRLELEEPDAEGWRAFRLTLEIAPGWHLHANPASEEGLVATRVEGLGCRLRRLSYPEGVPRAFGFAEQELRVYEQEAVLTGELLEAEQSPRLRLTWQPCDERRCLASVGTELEVSAARPG
jgi:uncharacterized protein